MARNSKRPPGAVPVLDDLPRFDIALARRIGLTPATPVTVDGIRVSTGQRTIELTWMEGRRRERQCLDIEHLDNPVCGKVSYCRCPECDGRCRVLRLWRGGWRCGTCINGLYAAERQSPRDTLIRQIANATEKIRRLHVGREPKWAIMPVIEERQALKDRLKTEEKRLAKAARVRAGLTIADMEEIIKTVYGAEAE
jgi:hypothetical protein